MADLEDLIIRDTRANQPAAGIPGRLYYVTDEGVTERDNGATWDDYSDSGSGGSVATDAIWDTKGDLAVATGADAAAKLAAGSNGQHLVVDSAEATGLKWATGGRQLIATASPSGTGTVTFAAIPGTYQALEILFTARSTKSGANNEEITVELNADATAANYRSTYIQAHSSSPATVGGEGRDVNAIAIISADSSPANSPGAGRILIPFYASTTFNKVAESTLAYRFDSSSIHLVNVRYALEWENAAAITQIVLKLASGNFVAGSTFRLYGIS